MNRRQIIKAIGLGGIMPAFTSDLSAEVIPELFDQEDLANLTLDKAITAITIGAGARGNVYGGYSLKYPEQLDIVGVAEPIAVRNERYSTKHNIPENNRFKTWEDVFKVPKFADAVIISTPDNLHYGPCMAALKMGYHVLLEKPISPSEQECREILALSKKQKRIVAVCHVLRYAPYFQQLRTFVQSGAIGTVVSMQHLEPIEHIHMSHSYVRGNWHNSLETTPIILAKSCHDLDIVKWVLGKKSKQIHAQGSLKWFTAKKCSGWFDQEMHRWLFHRKRVSIFCNKNLPKEPHLFASF